MNGALVLPLRSDQRVFSIMMTKIVRIGGSGCAEAEPAEATNTSNKSDVMKPAELIRWLQDGRSVLATRVKRGRPRSLAHHGHQILAGDGILGHI